jgi:tetratricopeptide (TPR) repeat protein
MARNCFLIACLCGIVAALSAQNTGTEAQQSRQSPDTTVIENVMIAPSKNKSAMNAYNIGTRYLRANDFHKATVYLKQAIKFDPEFVDAMDHLGVAYRNQGQYAAAIAMYRRSIAINPRNTTPHINLAVIYRLQGNMEGARQEYMEVMSIEQENPESYYGIGLLYNAAEMYGDSIEYINKAIQLYIKLNSALVYDACLIQGDNYYELYDYSEALRYYKIAAIGYPDNEALQQRIAEF